jgi:hypothetical protein
MILDAADHPSAAAVASPHAVALKWPRVEPWYVPALRSSHTSPSATKWRAVYHALIGDAAAVNRTSSPCAPRGRTSSSSRRCK